jgi:aspartate beta-hydroxylase
VHVDVLQNNDLAKAVTLLQKACATERGRTSSFALGHLCNVLIWSGDRAESDRVAEGAVLRGVWDTVVQRPLNFTRDLPTSPFPDANGLGYPEVAEAMRSIEQAVLADLRAIKDDVNICQEANEAPEGLQDPSAGSWEYTKINFNGLAWSFFGPWGDAQFPALSRILTKVQLAGKINIESAGLSTVYPGAVIRPHCGPTNKCWDIHVGISVPEQNATHLVVAGVPRPWAEGEALLFDDSFEHEVAHRGRFPRSILDVVITHPHIWRSMPNVPSPPPPSPLGTRTEMMPVRHSGT